MRANSKKRKVGREVKTIVNEDIISNLPDSILHHILSFLPTRHAVSTCLLSKRWKNLWMSTTKLRFSLECMEQFYKFPFLIDHVLLYHSSNITQFYLYTFGWFCDLAATLVKSWIPAAVNRQVQDVVLLTPAIAVISLPLCLCNSKMLTSLTVGPCTLDLPSKVSFSSLKFLDLDNVRFLDYNSFNSLFSGLPNIEELKLKIVYHNNVKNYSISLPTLKRCRLNLLLYGSDDRGDCFIKVNAENLVYLCCRSGLDIDLYLDKMPSLAGADIVICSPKQREREAYRATNLLAGICFTKSLTIGERSLTALCRLGSKGNRNLFPRFVNLTTLNINSKVTCNAAPALMDIFQSAPILELIVIQEVSGGKWSRKPYSHDIPVSLENCNLLRFGGSRANIRFIKFVLEAAKGLKRLKLYCTRRLCKQEKKLQDVMNELKALPRASDCCVIELVIT